jgi:2,3-bisphosphoglycerate-dependent phosphoglycerate mutase
VISQPTELYLIRHGQAIVNVEPIIGGMKGDTGLTPLGISQAEALRDRWLAEDFQADVLLASTLPRARQTAEILAPALKLTLALDDDLQEFRVGPEGDGLPIDEYKARFGWIDFDEHPFTEVDPGGESWGIFMLRVATTLQKIARLHAGKRIVCVTHGGVVDGSLVHFFQMNPHAPPPVRLHTINTSITHWSGDLERNRRRWSLITYNDSHHLDAL